MFCCTLLYLNSSIAIILMGKRELVALLKLSSWCLVMVERLFLAVPRGCLRFVIVVFPDHTHLLFLIKNAVWFKSYVRFHQLLMDGRTGLHNNYSAHLRVVQCEINYSCQHFGGRLDLAVLFNPSTPNRQKRNQVRWNTPSSKVVQTE